MGKGKEEKGKKLKEGEKKEWEGKREKEGAEGTGSKERWRRGEQGRGRKGTCLFWMEARMDYGSPYNCF